MQPNAIKLSLSSSSVVDILLWWTPFMPSYNNMWSRSPRCRTCTILCPPLQLWHIGRPQTNWGSPYAIAKFFTAFAQQCSSSILSIFTNFLWDFFLWHTCKENQVHWWGELVFWSLGVKWVCEGTGPRTKKFFLQRRAKKTFPRG